MRIRRHSRFRIFQRDRGQCAICAVNAQALRDVLVACIMPDGKRPVQGDPYGPYLPHEREWGDACRALGYHPWRAFWDVDHIKRFMHGGPCTMANLRTLCRPCHLKVTADQRRKDCASRVQ